MTDSSATDSPTRLLILLPFPPRLDGDHGAARVSAQLITALAGRVQIAVLCLRHPSERESDEVLLGQLERFDQVPRPDVVSVGRRAARAASWRLLLALGRPFWVSDLHSQAFRRRLVQVVEEFRPDVVQIEFSALGQYLRALPRGLPRVLVEHDPTFQTQPVGSRPLPRHRFHARVWRRFQRRVLEQVDTAVVFTEADRALLRQLTDATPVVRIPFGTDLVRRPALGPGPEQELLFVGNFVHPPNIDAAEWLVQSIFPRVRQSCRGCTLSIVGSSPTEKLIRAAGDGVAVTGRVPEVLPYLERAAVVVAPLRSGGGMRVKVVEALAAGKAVVATPLAAEGLDVRDGVHLRLARDPDEFARVVTELLEDPAAREALGARARAWAMNTLSWDATAAQYERLYAQLLARGAAADRCLATPSA